MGAKYTRVKKPYMILHTQYTVYESYARDPVQLVYTTTRVLLTCGAQ